MMRANLASIMPQIVGVWCEEAGHEVHFVCYTGTEDLHPRWVGVMDQLERQEANGRARNQKYASQ
jgi:hypothetical protein